MSVNVDSLPTPQCRGERNQNPTNLSKGSPPIAWPGLAHDQSTDPRFAVFSTPEYGISAAVSNMRTHAERVPGLTLGALISIWAPPNENNTAAYITSVEVATGVHRNNPINVFNRALMLIFVKAIIRRECGRVIYPDPLIEKAFDIIGEWKS